MPTKYSSRRASLQVANVQNRAARRRDRAQHRKALQDFIEESAGLVAISIVRTSGPRPNDYLLGLIYQWAYKVAASDAPAPCLTCDAVLAPTKELGPAGWLILHPMRSDCTTVSTAAFCQDCAARHNDDFLCDFVARDFGGRTIPIGAFQMRGGRA